MIIDVTNTIGKHKYKKEIKVTDLLEAMDKAGVDMAVVHCHPEYDDNASVEEAFKKYPDRIIGLFTVNPWDTDSPKRLKSALQRGFKGLYMNPVRHGYSLCEYRVFYPLLDICKKYKVPVMIYGAAEVFSAPIFFDQIAKDYPDLNIIMERMGLQYDNASAVEVCKRYSNVFIETSASMDFNTHRVIKNCGAEKALLGTGTPDSGYFELELVKVRNAAKEYESGIEKVCGLNAMKIFGIEEA